MKGFGRSSFAGFAAAIVISLVAVVPAVYAQAKSGDAQIQADVAKALNNNRYKGIKTVVQSGNVILQGTVANYSDKESADNRAHHVKGVKGVDNLIAIGGPSVDDVTLRNKLAQKISYDRVGYGTTAFNAFTIGVKNGVVTLGGTATGPVDKDSAISIVANEPGVKDIVDNIEVAPLSPNDDRLRRDLFRSIYGAPQLQKYAMDPAAPIRITVINGNVTLSGVVDNKGDSDVANIRANTVSGVFHVTNNLQVAGSQVKK